MAEQIAAGWNNAAGLTNWTAIAPTGGEYLLSPYLDSGYSPGNLIVKTDGTDYERGFPVCVLTFSYMLYDQLEHLKTTYGGGGFSGKVTFRSKLVKGGTEANYNAIMKLTTPPDSSESIYHIRDYVIRMTRITAI